MGNIKYFCPGCGYEAKAPSLYPNCRVLLVASRLYVETRWWVNMFIQKDKLPSILYWRSKNG